MRETPLLENGYLFFSTRNLNCINSVKIPLTWGQSAWAVKSSSETKRNAFSSDNALLNDKNFIHWFVGIVDSDGTFSFQKSKNESWAFSFQISQSSYNLRLLYYIKQKLKVGSIFVDEKNSIAVYKVRNKKHILDHILPIFDSYSLRTSKAFRYNIFKSALLISYDNGLSRQRKDTALIKLKDKYNVIPITYKSPVWSSNSNFLKSKENAEKIIDKFWLVGFVEAEGSFYLVQKSPNRLVHFFEITQKLDKHLLQAISLILEIEVGVKKKKTHFSLVTSKKQTIEFIIKFFFKTMKGMKSLEYRIWAKSFIKKYRGFNYLLTIRNKMRNIRSIRFDKNWRKE